MLDRIAVPSVLLSPDLLCFGTRKISSIWLFQNLTVEEVYRYLARLACFASPLAIYTKEGLEKPFKGRYNRSCYDDAGAKLIPQNQLSQHSSEIRCCNPFPRTLLVLNKKEPKSIEVAVFYGLPPNPVATRESRSNQHLGISPYS